MSYDFHFEMNNFWNEIQTILSRLNLEIEKSVDNVISKISNHSNKSFPLNGYLSLTRKTDDNELAISINVYLKENLLSITSDICMEDGRIIAEGPSVELNSNTLSIRNIIISDWINEFTLFLDKEKTKIIEELLHSK